jgi:myosin V
LSICFFFTHRLEECTAEKDSLLAVERKQNKTTKEELANAQKTIDELVHESQQSQEIRNQLEDTIKRSDAFSSDDVSELLS